LISRVFFSNFEIFPRNVYDIILEIHGWHVNVD
jgi:hypothetical protein